MSLGGFKRHPPMTFSYEVISPGLDWFSPFGVSVISAANLQLSGSTSNFGTLLIGYCPTKFILFAKCTAVVFVPSRILRLLLSSKESLLQIQSREDDECVQTIFSQKHTWT